MYKDKVYQPLIPTSFEKKIAQIYSTFNMQNPNNGQAGQWITSIIKTENPFLAFPSSNTYIFIYNFFIYQKEKSMEKI